MICPKIYDIQFRIRSKFPCPPKHHVRFLRGHLKMVNVIDQADSSKWYLKYTKTRLVLVFLVTFFLGYNAVLYLNLFTLDWKGLVARIFSL